MPHLHIHVSQISVSVLDVHPNSGQILGIEEFISKQILHSRSLLSSGSGNSKLKNKKIIIFSISIYCVPLPYAAVNNLSDLRVLLRNAVETFGFYALNFNFEKFRVRKINNDIPKF